MGTTSLTTIQKIVESIDKSPDLPHALNRLVDGIHQALRVDVCSIYLSDLTNNTNVLMATYGLNPDAVGKVVIPFNEGLVGLVTELSEPVNVNDAPHHPRFKYIPESGEEPYKSFLGVPLSHFGENLGVLVVQQVAARQFEDRDIAFLSTLATLISANIAYAKARGLIDAAFSNSEQSGGLLVGVAGAPGVCIGTGVIVYNHIRIAEVPDRKAEDLAEEESRLRAAINAVVMESQSINEQLGEALPAADRMLFDAYALMASSDELINTTLEQIAAGNWAAGALRETIQSYAEKFESLDDPYMRERANDIRNIGQRILSYLLPEESIEREYPENTILIGENLSPLDLVKVAPDKLTAIISGHGSPYSHIAILAHALNIPAVLGFSEQIHLNRLDGKHLIVDGYQGHIHINPEAAQRQQFQELIEEERQLSEEMTALRDLPAQTPDGVRIHLYTNTGLLSGYTSAFDVGTEGIGLYRTELLFMSRDRFPSEEEQRSLYREVIKNYAPKPVTLRVLDIGGDKILPYYNIKEPNPFLGWRGIRLLLDHPEILLTQVRAMLRASHGYDNLKILLPMISNLDELERALKLIRQAYAHIDSEKDGAVPFPPIGAMIEVPSAVYQLDAIAKRVDYLTVGTNDLIQYLLAIDRNNERVAKMFDPLQPSVLEILSQITAAAKRHHKPLSICGEAAGDPALAILLIALGVDALSLSAGDLPRIKWIIRTISHDRASLLWQQARQLEHAGEIRALLYAELDSAGLGGLIRPGK